MPRKKYALLSVYDKTGIVKLAEALLKQEFEILSTGGTAKALEKAGIPVTKVSTRTGSPEMFDGRVKTLHPLILGGVLYMRGNAQHEADAEANNVSPIDVVVCNLYPFEQTIAQPGCTMPQAIEQIDVGGPTMIRAAAKNNASVIALTDPEDYESVIEEMASPDGVSKETRQGLAIKVFAMTLAYDTAIHDYLVAQQG